MSQEAREFAAGFLEDVISFFGVNVLVEAREEGPEEDGVITLNVPSTRMNGFLIGQNGDNLRALQNLANMALRSNGYEDITATVDVAGYKRQRNQRLERDVQKFAQQVKDSGEDYELEPMNSYDRRLAHRTISDIEGVESESVGEGKERKVVIRRGKTSTGAGAQDAGGDSGADESGSEEEE